MCVCDLFLSYKNGNQDNHFRKAWDFISSWPIQSVVALLVYNQGLLKQSVDFQNPQNRDCSRPEPWIWLWLRSELIVQTRLLTRMILNILNLGSSLNLVWILSFCALVFTSELLSLITEEWSSELGFWLQLMSAEKTHKCQSTWKNMRTLYLPLG